MWETHGKIFLKQVEVRKGGVASWDGLVLSMVVVGGRKPRSQIELGASSGSVLGPQVSSL